MPASSEEQDKELPTVPVEVINFPDTQNVTVANFPETQNVSGTINVGNLPEDEEGNILVNLKKTDIFTKTIVVNEDIDIPPGFTFSNIIETGGYRNISFHIVRLSGNYKDINSIEVQSRIFSDEDFATVRMMESYQSFRVSAPSHIFCPITGNETRLRINGDSNAQCGHYKITAYLTK